MSAAGMVIGTSISGSRSISASGYRSSLDTETPLKMLSDTSFDLASLTKIVATTSSLMELVALSELSVEDPVSQYIPAWNTSEKKAITIRHLLEHRSGLWEWRPLYISAADPDAAHALIARAPLRYAVNTEKHYSDLGFITLGAVITAITGKVLVESVYELSLNKLALTSTGFAIPRDMNNVAATSRGDRYEKAMVDTKIPYPVAERSQDFSAWRTRILNGELNDGNAFHLFKGASSHAGLFSNADDLLNFGESLLNSPELQFFTEEGVDSHTHLGFRSWVNTHGSCSARFYGHTGFTGVIFALSPRHNAVFVGLSNRLQTDGEIIPTEDIFASHLKDFHSRLH
jgi:CubicO group peptidase (beta-lactamase class C family)